jgi:hypothetical protein
LCWNEKKVGVQDDFECLFFLCHFLFSKVF